MVILLPHPALRTNVRAPKQALELGRKIGAVAEAYTLRHFAIDRRLPPREWTLVHRRIVGQRCIRNLRHNLAVFEHAHLGVQRDAANFNRIQSPLLEHAEYFLFASLLRDQQHAFLRLAEHNLVRSHARFALRDAVQFNFDSCAAARTHLAGRAGQASRAHILYAHDGPGLHRLEAGFQQQLFKEWISDLNVGALRFRTLAELLARHGGAVDAVASGLRAHVNYRIPLARCASVKDLIAAHQPQGKGIHQRIAGIARLELHLAAKVRDAETVAVRSDARNHALHNRMVLVDFGLCSAGGRARVFRSLNRPKPQRVHNRNWPRAHGENIAQNSTDAGRRSLKRFNK